ncbi:MAG: OmpA/MotB domain protein [Chlorobi bacterium]|nr:OmpA/MotB domain protein [Chlorobiota bacterium]
MRCSLSGQGIVVQPIGGFERGSLVGIQRQPGVINRFHFSGTGISYNNAFMFGVDVSSRHLLGGAFGGTARSGVVTTFGKFISDAYASDSAAIDIDTRQHIPTDNQFSIAATQTLLHLEVLVSYDLGGGWMLNAGPWMRYRVLSEIVETERILGPSEGVFAEGNGKDRVSVGDYLAGSSFRWGGLGSISYSLQLTKNLAIRPELHARLDAVALAEGLTDRRSMSFGASLGLSFNFSPRDTVRLAVVPIVDTQAIISSRSHITASIDLFGTDSLGRKLDAAIIDDHRTLYRQYLELPAVIFFDRGSDRLPERYRQIGNADTGAATDYGYRPPLSVCHDLLNILGRRMRDLPSSTIQLKGGESASIEARRVERIRTYLHDTWGIDRERITAAAVNGPGNGHAGQDASIAIIPSTQILIAPFLMKWVVNDRIIPNIGLNKLINSEMGVREWSLILRQGRHELKRLSNRDGGNNDIDAAFTLAGMAVDSGMAPLVAELEITDYAGGRFVTSDSVQLRVSGSGGKIDAENTSYVFIEPAGVARKALIADICSIVRDGARVLVESDSIADNHGWNAYPMAQAILDSITSRGVRPLEVLAHLRRRTADEHEAMFPEEMLLGRAVRVVVEQEEESGRH